MKAEPEKCVSKKTGILEHFVIPICSLERHRSVGHCFHDVVLELRTRLIHPHGLFEGHNRKQGEIAGPTFLMLTTKSEFDMQLNIAPTYFRRMFSTEQVHILKH
jgi:hypothetical protein